MARPVCKIELVPATVKARYREQPRFDVGEPLPVVRFDVADGSWRIGCLRQATLRSGWRGLVFDPLLWLRFASEKAAREHLAWRGAW